MINLRYAALSLDPTGKGWPLARIVRVVEYTVPDRVGNGTGELIVLLSTVLDPAAAPRPPTWTPTASRSPRPCV